MNVWKNSFIQAGTTGLNTRGPGTFWKHGLGFWTLGPLGLLPRGGPGPLGLGKLAFGVMKDTLAFHEIGPKTQGDPETHFAHFTTKAKLPGKQAQQRTTLIPWRQGDPGILLGPIWAWTNFSTTERPGGLGTKFNWKARFLARGANTFPTGGF